MLRAYLAGPEVFLRKPLEQAERKIEICRKYGIVGVFPLDNELVLSGLGAEEQAYTIARANERLMRNCDIMIANITPYHGPSADVGVAYEMGFMRGIDRKVYAYSNDSRSFFQRLQAMWKVLMHENGVWYTPEKMAVENFNLADNLMLANAVHESGGEIIARKARYRERYTDLGAFEEAVRLAAKAHSLIPVPSQARLPEPV